MGGDAQLGQALRKLREARGVTLKAAASALDTERHATISEIESGKRTASFSEMVKLSTFYGMTMSDLLDAVAGKAECFEVEIALPRATGALGDEDRAALSRLERLAREFANLKATG